MQEPRRTSIRSRAALRVVDADADVRRRRAVAEARNVRRTIDRRAAREARFAHLRRAYD